jgi:hypothetical protein
MRSNRTFRPNARPVQKFVYHNPTCAYSTDFAHLCETYNTQEP